MTIMPDDGTGLALFREDFKAALVRRGEALFELTDAVLAGPGRVEDLARLSLSSAFARGHGALYAAVNRGRIDFDALRRAVAACPVPRFADGQIVLATDVSNWLRPEAATSPERLFCHTYARGKGQSQMIPGWPYSFVAALGCGADSWTGLLDARRIGPDDDETAVTADQLRGVVARLRDCGAWAEGDPDILSLHDAGYNLTRLAFELEGLPVVVAGRVRSDRVFRRAAAPAAGRPGRPARHGGRLDLDDPDTWGEPDIETGRESTRWGRVAVTAFDRVHQKLGRRAAWAGHSGELPVVEGTLVRVAVERLPGNRQPKPLWLWAARTGATPAQVDLWWQAYLRRFDIEHTFRFLKQHLGWTKPMLRGPTAADRWTWLILACHTQLRLARPLAADLRLPWQPPRPPGSLTPAKVRADFPRIRKTLPILVGAPKNHRPGPGRPKGSKNHAKAPIQPVGKTSKRG